MAGQQLYRPSRRQARDEGVYDEPGNLPSAARDSQPVLDDTDRVLNDVDNVLAENGSALDAKNLSPEQLEAAESGGLESAPTGADSAESNALGDTDQVGKGYAGESKQRRWKKLSVRKKVAVGGGLGGTVITLAVFSILQGPAEFMQLDFALGRSTRAGSLVAEARIHGFARAVRAYNSGDVGETRVGFLGSRSFHNIMNRLESRHGITINRRIVSTGRPTTIRIEAKEGSPLWGATEAETRANILRNIPFPDESRLFRVGQTADGRFIFAATLTAEHARDLNKMSDSFVRLDNDTANRTRGKTILAMRNRVFKKFWNAPSLFNPINRVASDVDDRIRTRVDRARVERDRKNRSGKKSVLATKYKNAVDSARGKIKPGALSVTAGALTLTDGLCFLKEMSGLLPALNYASIVAPAMEEAVDKQAVASNIRAGKNLTADQPGYIASGFRDDKGGSIWGSRALNASLSGGAGSGIDADPGLKQAFEMRGSNISGLLDTLAGEGGDQPLLDAAAAGGDSIANLACSTVGYGIQIAIGGALTLLVPGGVVAKTAQVAQSMAIRNLLVHLFSDFLGGRVETAAKGMCGQDEDGLTVDAEAFGSCLAYGARAAHNANAASMGGVELSGTQERVLMGVLDEIEAEEFRQKSFFARTLDTTEPRSLVAGILRNTSPDATRNVSNLASFLVSSPANIFSALTSPFTAKAAAQQATYDWGDFRLVGIPLEIIEDPKYEDPFENSIEAAKIFNNGNNEIERAKRCFGVDIIKVSGRWQATPSEEVVPMENEYVDEKCSDLSEDWIRTMLFVFDDAIVTSMACYEGDSLSCGELGLGGGGTQTTTTPDGAGSQIEGDPYTDSTTVACAAGTKDLGVHDGYSDGQLIPLRLCSLSNLPSSGQADNPGGSYSTPGAEGKAIVNSRVSGAWYSLVEAARTGGVSFTARSSFRSMSHQQASCYGDLSCRNGDHTYVARPGYSSHQAGVAIDFGDMGVNGGATCATRARATSSAGWNWLNSNAASYGFKQYSAEAWHWDALPVANRCSG